MHVTIDVSHMVSLVAAMGPANSASWPQVISWLTFGTVVLIGALFPLLSVWLGLRLARVRRQVSVLDRAMDVVGSAVFITDAQRPEHPIIAVNPAFTRMTGYEGRGVLGRSTRLLEGPETEPQATKLVQAALREGRSCRTQATLYARDGKALPSDLILTALRDRRGRHTHTIWEIQARFLSNTAHPSVETAESLISVLVPIIPQPLLVTSEQGSIRTINPAAAHLFGYEPDELQNQPVVRILPSAKSLHHALKTGSPEPAPCETVGIRKDGAPIPLSVSIRDLVLGGDPHCAFTCEDLTHTKRDARRRASWEPLADLLATSARLTPDCARDVLQIICEHCEWSVGSLWTVDAETNELRCYQTHVAAGATLDQMAAAHRRSTCKPWEGVIGRAWCKGEPEWSADVAQEMDWVPRNPASHRGGVIAQPVKSEGKIIAVAEFFGVENPATDPSLLPMLASFAALTGQAMARSRAELEIEDLVRQVRTAQRGEALGSLAGGIAHDLNNTLTAILGYTELAFPTIPAASRARRHLKHIMKAGGRAKDLIHQVLAFSQQTESVLSPIRLQEVVHETLKLIRPSLPATIELKQSIEPDLPPVLGDPAQLRQVLANLCANSEHAMRGSQGTLEIQAGAVSVTPELARVRPALRAKRYARLTVRDTGCGMPARVKAQAFEPFFTTKPEGEGIGLGLAVVRGIVLHHGGAVYLESTPAQGTALEIFLPLVEQGVSEEPLPPDALPRGSERVLLVEDEPALAELGRDMLESLGYEVIVRTSPSEALRAFQLMPQQFDLMITDHTMPGMTGETLVHDVLTIRPDLPVLMMTGFSHTMNPDKAHALGVSAFLPKPLLLRDLAPAIRRALDHAASPSAPGGSQSRLDGLLDFTRSRQDYQSHAVGPDRRRR